MSNFSNGQQQRTTSPNPARQKEALSVAGCAQVCNWRSKVTTDGAKVMNCIENSELQKPKVRMSDESMTYGTASAEGFFVVNCGLIEAASSAKFLADVHCASGATLSRSAGERAKAFAYPDHSAKHFAQYSVWWNPADLRVNNTDSQILYGRNSYVQSSSVRLTSKPLKPLFSLDCAEMEQSLNPMISLNSGESPCLVKHEQYSGSIEHHSTKFLAQSNHNGNRDDSTAGEILTNPNVRQPLNNGQIGSFSKVAGNAGVARAVGNQMLTNVNVRAVFPSLQILVNIRGKPCVVGGCAGAIKKGQVSPALDMPICRYHAAASSELNSICMRSYGRTIFSPSLFSTPPLSKACTSLYTPRKSRLTTRESSRMDTACAPSIALIISQRLGASMVLASCSTVGNTSSEPMKSPLMARAAFAAAAWKASSTDITLTVNTLMVSPPEHVDVSAKAGNQVFNRGEGRGVFPFTDMLVVTFTALVVVAHHAKPINNVSQAVFVLMVTPQNCRVYLQNSDGGKSVVCYLDLGVHQLNGWHSLPLLSDVNHSITRTVMEVITSRKEKGQHSAPPLWDGFFSNYEENQQSTIFGDARKPDLAYGIFCSAALLYEQNQYLATQQDSHTEIIGGAYESFVGQSSDLALRRLSSPRATLTICRISSPAFVPISSTRASASREDSNGFSSLPSTWRRAISPRIAVTMNPALLSLSCLTASIPSITSWGIRTVVICDFAFLYTDIMSHLFTMCISLYRNVRYKKTCNVSHQSIKYIPRCFYPVSHAAGADRNNKAQQVIATPAGPLTTNVNASNEAAMSNITTHPQGRDFHTLNKFTWRFLALSATDSTVIRIIATTEREAREQSPMACVMVFAGRLPVQEVRHA